MSIYRIHNHVSVCRPNKIQKKKFLFLSLQFVLLEESLSQPTYRIASRFHIQLWGKSPEIQSMSSTMLWKATGSKHDGTGRRMARMIYQKAYFFGGSWFHLVHSVVFFPTMRPSVKARVCEDMSMPVVRGFHPRRLRSLLIDTVIRLLNLLWIINSMGLTLKQYSHLLYFFHPLEPCRSSLVVAIN